MRGRSPTDRNVLTHLTAAVVVPGCLALGWWQITRALSGNTLSWAYAFEWPIFAGYAVFLWWKLIHDQPGGEPIVDPDRAETKEAESPGAGTTGAGAHPESEAAGATAGSEDEDEDEELASYNRYLGALNASGKRKHW
ncbi:MAG TPA: hypothetical protein VNC61_17140 [Acidimicrobiales bacterium]|nr:hypothetical protein [Acidimicrobiales bacterium]